MAAYSSSHNALADSELASHLRISDADIREARQVELILQPRSLDQPLNGGASAASVADLLGEEDPQFEHVLGMRAIATHWASCQCASSRS